jgi:predicted AAA+ superfamily ATPase
VGVERIHTKAETRQGYMPGPRRAGTTMILELGQGFRELLQLRKEIEDRRSSIYMEFGIKS